MLKRCVQVAPILLAAAALTSAAAAPQSCTASHYPGNVEVGFSPDGGAEAVILKAINCAEKSLRVAAYSFTSPNIVRALVNAKKRGVDVEVIVDEKGNKGRSSISALDILAQADIPVRTISSYAIHHDKYVVVDETHVQTGSFNYTRAAAKSNSENVILIWERPDIAASYLRHWNSRFEMGRQHRLNY